MATGPQTKISDVVVPEIFTPYIRQMTERKSRIVQSGAMVRNGAIDNLLAGGGLIFQIPSWRDLDDDEENISNDATPHIVHLAGGLSGTAAVEPTPKKIETDTEKAVRLNRNQSWGSADLIAALAGEDPMMAIADRVAAYWVRRLQAAFVAVISGVIKDNSLNDSGDYAADVAGTSFSKTATIFDADAVIDARTTMGDSLNQLSLIMMHSIVFSRLQKNNLISFIPDARGEIMIPTYLNAEVVVDDGMPSGTKVTRKALASSALVPGTTGVFDTWMFGPAAAQLGIGTAKVPTEVARYANAGNGAGAEVLHSRQEYCIHPTGYAYTGTAPNGGPSNAATAHNFNNDASWDRVYPERKMIKFARLVTREA